MIDVFNAFQSEKVGNNCKSAIIIKKLGKLPSYNERDYLLRAIRSTGVTA